eukprot:2114677-Pleurochrysis_carterae.AAC.1
MLYLPLHTNCCTSDYALRYYYEKACKMSLDAEHRPSRIVISGNMILVSLSSTYRPLSVTVPVPDYALCPWESHRTSFITTKSTKKYIP